MSYISAWQNYAPLRSCSNSFNIMAPMNMMKVYYTVACSQTLNLQDGNKSWNTSNSHPNHTPSLFSAEKVNFTGYTS